MIRLKLQHQFCGAEVSQSVLIPKCLVAEVSGSQSNVTESVWSVSKLSTESVGSRRELVANCIHTSDADASQLDSFVASASAVCIGH